MRLNFILLILLWRAPAIAQQKYIEVSVSDTVLAKADCFSYRIWMSPAFDNTEFIVSKKNYTSAEDRMQQHQSKAGSSFDSLLQKLKTLGFSTDKPSLGDSLNIYKMQRFFYSTRVLTHSLDSLRLLCNRLRDQKYLSAYLESSASSNDSTFQKRLLKKIVEKARAKAETIAALSDLHVRGVLSVEENKAEKGRAGGWTSYPPPSDDGDATDVIPGWHTTIYPSTGAESGNPMAIGWYPIAASYTIRFWVE